MGARVGLLLLDQQDQEPLPVRRSRPSGSDSRRPQRVTAVAVERVPDPLRVDEPHPVGVPSRSASSIAAAVILGGLGFFAPCRRRCRNDKRDREGRGAEHDRDSGLFSRADQAFVQTLKWGSRTRIWVIRSIGSSLRVEALLIASGVGAS